VTIHAMPSRAPTPAQAAPAARVALLFVAATLTVAPAAAAPLPARPASVRLSYARESGAERCPDEAVLRDSVSSRLGYDPFDPAAERTLRVVVRRTRGTLVAQIELLDASGHAQGERRLEGSSDDCVELGSAMAIAASLGIDPLAATAAPQARPPSVPPPVPHEEQAAAPPPPAAPSSLPPVPPPAVASEPTIPIRARFAVAGVAAIGVAPASPAWGATFAAGFRRAWASVDLEGAADWAPTAERDGAGAKSALYMVSVVPCVHLGIGVGCALGGVGALAATGVLNTPLSDHAFYADFGLRLGVEVPVTAHFFVQARVDALATLTHVTYTVDNGQPFWATPPVSAALGLGVGVVP
jgi:hypothetical protein